MAVILSDLQGLDYDGNLHSDEDISWDREVPYRPGARKLREILHPDKGTFPRQSRQDCRERDVLETPAASVFLTKISPLTSTVSSAAPTSQLAIDSP